MSKSSAYRAYIQSPEWNECRVAAINRAGRRCQLCGQVGKLHVHHNNYSRLGNEEDRDLTVLCEACHNDFHKAQQRRALEKRQAHNARKKERKHNSGFTAKEVAMLVNQSRHRKAVEERKRQMAAESRRLG